MGADFLNLNHISGSISSNSDSAIFPALSKIISILAYTGLKGRERITLRATFGFSQERLIEVVTSNIWKYPHS